MDYRVARVLRFVIYIIVGLLILLLIWTAFNGIKNLLSTANTSSAPESKAINLNDYKTNGSQLQYVIEGPVVANQNFRKTVITISATQAVVQVTKGYESAPALSQAFANNQTAYNTFIAALNSANFTGLKAAPDNANRAGACPLGDKYSYQVIEKGAYAQDTWNNSCSVSYGTFAGNTSLVQQLFQSQIPDYFSVTGSVQ